MKLLFFGTYYYPYISGITTYPRLLLTHLAQKHQVTVLTFRHDPSLPPRQTDQSVTIIRMPFLARLSKGFLSPQSLYYFWQAVREADLVFINIPNFEGMFLVLLARLYRKPILVIFHCQVFLGNTFSQHLINACLNLSIKIQLHLASQIIIYTKDYFHSLNPAKSLKRKAIPLLPPVPTPPVNTRFAQKLAKSKQESIWIGFAGRFAREKGIEYLIEALTRVSLQYPHLTLVHAGPSGPSVIGEDAYSEKIIKQAKASKLSLIQLGTLEAGKLGAFYQKIDLLALPSINQTEAFGMVQVEAMLLGTPVVVSNLPGVRYPIQQTGMGIIVTPTNINQLAHSIIAIIKHRDKYTNPVVIKKAQKLFNYHHTFTEYDKILNQFS